MHEPPDASQRRHWYATESGVVPPHVPAPAVRVCPTCAVPEIEGAFVAVGGVAGAGSTTGGVGGDVADAVPAAFDATTLTASCEPTSACERAYWLLAAPLIDTHELLQRFHAYRYAIGASPVHEPGEALSVFPATGVPESAGAAVECGGCTEPPDGGGSGRRRDDGCQRRRSSRHSRTCSSPVTTSRMRVPRRLRRVDR